LRETESQETTKGAGKCTEREDEGRSLTSLRLLVHRPDIDVDAGDEPSLEKADQKTASVESIVILDEGYNLILASVCNFMLTNRSSGIF
jgi:hypothetical protein